MFWVGFFIVIIYLLKIHTLIFNMFLREYSNATRTTINLVKALNVQVSVATIEESIETHPDAGTLLSISDSLNKWNIPNAAAKISVSDIEKIPTPFIAQLNYPSETVFTVVTSVSDDVVICYSNEKRKYISQGRNEFVKKFNDVILAVEVKENSGEVGYNEKKWSQIVKAFIPSILIGAMCIAYLIGLGEKLSEPEFIWLLPSMLLGSILSFILAFHEIDDSNPIIDKVCSSIPKGNCNAVLNSRGAHIFSWLSWSEVGLFYFVGGLIVLLFPNTVVFVCALSICAMLYTVYSVVYQWRVVKRWCALCLAVQVVLLVQGILSIFLYIDSIRVEALINSLPYVMLAYSIPMLFWYLIKPYLLEMAQLRFIKVQYTRMKYNVEFFKNNLISQQKVDDVCEQPLGVLLGEKSSNFRHQIIAACNPYCGHCGNAHKILDEIIEENTDVQVKIIFTTPNSADSYSYSVVRYFLQLQYSDNSKMLKSAMSFWYENQGRKDTLEKMQQQFPVININDSVDIGKEIEEMRNWCDKVLITGTPTLFYDGHRLPDVYSPIDLKYIVKE